MTENPSTKERIKLATIEAIEQFGLDQLTTRLIADKAEANIASINYYFRTKDDLIDEVLQMTIDHMLEDVFAEISNPEHDLDSLLEAVLFYLIDGCRRFPGITTAQLHHPIIEKDFDTPGAQGMQMAFNLLTNRVTELMPDQDSERIRFLLSRILGSIMFMMITPSFLEVDPTYQPADQERCRRLAQEYTNWFIAGI